MPPIGRNVIDQSGVEILSDWINSPGICQGNFGEIGISQSIKLDDSSVYISTEDDELTTSENASSTSSRWIFEKVTETHFRIKNAADKTLFLNIESRSPRVSVIDPVWHSAMWSIEEVDQGVRIRNRWTNQYLVLDENFGLTATAGEASDWTIQ